MLNRRQVRCCAPFEQPVGGGSAASGAAIDARMPAEGVVLDAEALRRLRDLDPGGASRLLERVFQAFEASTIRLVPQLHAASRAGNNDGIRHVAHTLKSSSASIGAIKLSRLCAEIESMIRLDTVDGLEVRIDQMDREIGLVLQALRQLPGTAS